MGGSLRNASGVLTNDPLTKATMFNDSFSAAFTTDNCTVPDLLYSLVHCRISNILFPTSSVLKQLGKLKTSKTTSPDDFSAHTLKMLGAPLAYPLACLFEFIFSHSFVPECWKLPTFHLIIKRDPVLTHQIIVPSPTLVLYVG